MILPLYILSDLSGRSRKKTNVNVRQQNREALTNFKAVFYTLEDSLGVEVKMD